MAVLETKRYTNRPKGKHAAESGTRLMTKLLEKAFDAARELPAEQQNAIAAIILEEIKDDSRWDAAFADSVDILERLAAEAEKEDRKGLTQDLDPDSM